ncbi:MAG: hypothetical protein V4671_10585 [Armatimonadota bacterium]
MAINWRFVWQQLNERQQAYLAVLYVAEQTKAVVFETPAYAKHPLQKGAEWRWCRYYTKDIKQGLDGRITRLGMRDPGTGSTWEALAIHDYIEHRWEAPVERMSGVGGPSGHDDLDHLSVKLTTKGRKLIRENLGQEYLQAEEFLGRIEYRVQVKSPGR